MPKCLFLMAPWSLRCTQVRQLPRYLFTFLLPTLHVLQIPVARKAEKEILAGGLTQSHLRYVFRSQYLQGVQRYAIYRVN